MDKAFEAVLAWWDAVGVDTPDLKPAPKTPVRAAPQRVQAKPAQTPQPSQAAQQTPAVATTVIPTPDLTHVKSLDGLRTFINGFDAGALSDHARQAVFSRGNPDADIMVIGEAPGRDEDIQGKPFVGRSGQLLDKMFASIGLTDEHIYITNVVNWRPPGNRNPNTEELLFCKPLITRHIELFMPKIIVMVGGISFSALTGQNGIMKNRGQWTYLSIGGHNIPALPIYHPAFLLRQTALKRDAWRDLLSLRERINALA